MNKKFVIGLILGYCIVFAIGAGIDVGGNGTYQMQANYDGTVVSVIDTRTGTLKVFKVRPGDKVESFNDDERALMGYRTVTRK